VNTRSATDESLWKGWLKVRNRMEKSSGECSVGGPSACATAARLSSLPLALVSLHLRSKGTNGILGSNKS